MGSFSRKLNRSRPKAARGSPIRELRRLVSEASDLRLVTDYFDVNLVPDADFMRSGEPRSNEVLISMVQLALKVSIGDEKPRQGQLFYVASAHLWHGYLLFEGGLLARVLHFDDINLGVCSVVKQKGERTHHFRFSIPEGIDSAIDVAQAELVGITRRSSRGEPS